MDYIVRAGHIELVDEYRPRGGKPRWPDGLQAAVEAKEGVRLAAAGHDPRLDHLAALPPCLSESLPGMTATAEAAAEREFQKFYEVP